MANIFDYLKWRGDLRFDQDPVNGVDALIFSTLSYIRYGPMVESAPETPIPLWKAAEGYFALEDRENRVRVKNDMELLRQAAQTVRFGQTQYSGAGDAIRGNDLLVG